MSELIRRSDAIAIIQNADYKYPTWPHIVEAKAGMVQAIKSAHTIDAVQVVRCGECYKKNTSWCGMKHERADMDYCSYGERRKP
jgi:hypothetical protein